jgi:membrane-associated phospholipid phosphatase
LGHCPDVLRHRSCQYRLLLSELLNPSRAFFVLWLPSCNRPVTASALYRAPCPWLATSQRKVGLYVIPIRASRAPGAPAAAFSILGPGYRLTFHFMGFILCASRLVLGRHYPSDMLLAFLPGPSWCRVGERFRAGRLRVFDLSKID